LTGWVWRVCECVHVWREDRVIFFFIVNVGREQGRKLCVYQCVCVLCMCLVLYD
jgi:hypothetical protein